MRGHGPNPPLLGRTGAVVLALALGWTFVYTDRTALFSLAPVIGRDLGLTGTQQGALASAYFLLYVAMQVPSGWLADRAGLKRVLVGMYILMGLALVGIGLLAWAYLPLLALVALEGFGAGAYYATSYGTTVSVVPQRRRGVASGVVSAGMALGLLLGLGASPLLYSALGSWQAVFRVLAVPTLLMVPLFLALLPGRAEVPPSRGGLGALLRSRDLLALSFASFLSMYGYWVVLTWGPDYLLREKGLSLERAGLYTGLVAVPAMAGAWLWGRASDRLGRKWVLGLVLPAMGVSLLALTFLQGDALLLIALALFGLVSSVAQNPVWVAWAGDLAFRTPGLGVGTAIGFFNMASVAGSFIAPLVAGWTRDLTGSVASSFWLAGGLAFLAGLLVLLPRETLTEPAPVPSGTGPGGGTGGKGGPASGTPPSPDVPGGRGIR